MQYISRKLQSGVKPWLGARRRRVARGAVWLLAIAALFPPSAASPAAAVEPGTVTYELVSVSTAGTDPSGGSIYPAMSPDGRFVTFTSYASDIVPGDTNGAPDIFVYDRHSHQTTRASVAADGGQLRDSYQPFISANGRYVMFTTNAPQLAIAGGIVMKDLETGALRRVDVSQADTPPDGNAYPLALTPDGRYALFWSSFGQLFPGRGPGVFRKDLVTGALDAVSLSGATPADTRDASVGGAISADGRYIAFNAAWNNVAPGDGGGGNKLYFRDMERSGVQLVHNPFRDRGPAGASGAPSISADGRFVAFQSNATDIVSGIATSLDRIYMWDRDMTQFSLISPANASRWSGFPTVSATGRHVGYYEDLGAAAVFDRQAGTRVSFRAYPFDGARIPLSADGRLAAVIGDPSEHGNHQNIYVVALEPPPPPALVPIPGDVPGFPPTAYPYAAMAITVDPYPATQGEPIAVGVMLSNPTDTAAVVVSADFFISTFGAGVPWDLIGSVRNVTIPAAENGNPGRSRPNITWRPPFDGHHCVQVRLTFADGRQQTLQRNIDILGVSSGGPVSGPATIGNPTPATAAIALRLLPVAMQPEGWTAALDRTSLNLEPGAVDTVNLTLSPPAGAPAGSYAMYNVEAYVGAQLIGGFSRTAVIGELPTPVVVSPVAGHIHSSSVTVAGTALPGAYLFIGVLDGPRVDTLADQAGSFQARFSLEPGQHRVIVQQMLGDGASPVAGGREGIPFSVGEPAAALPGPVTVIDDPVPLPYGYNNITVEPYPPVSGQPATLGMRLRNGKAAAETITSADFYVSDFGLANPWLFVASVKHVTVPAAATVDGITTAGTAHPTVPWTPPFSGHHCVQVRLTFADGHQVTVQRNIEILGFTSGGPHTVTGQIGNPTGQVAEIDLKIVRVSMAPDGWTAALDRYSVPLAPGAVERVSLTLTPPAGAAAGSHATFCVEGRIGLQLFGGFCHSVIIGTELLPPVVAFPTPNAPVPPAFMVTGTALPGALVHIRLADQVAELWTVAGGDGGWSLPLSLPPGRYSLLVTQEIGGRVSAPAGGLNGVPFRVGGESPAAISPPVPAGSWVGTPDLTVCGTAPPNATVRIRVRDLKTGAEDWVTVVADAQGNWCTTVHFPHDCDYELTPWIGEEPGSPVLLHVDITGPAVTPELPPANNGWYSGAVTARLAIGDGRMGSGVTCFDISLDGGQTWIAYPEAGVTVTGDGAHTMLWRACDVAGNTSGGTITIPIDTEAPRVTVGYDPETGTVTLAPADPAGGGGGGEGSGIDSLEVDTGSGWRPYSGPIGGAGDIDWRCRDRAGNLRQGRISIPRPEADDQFSDEGEPKAFNLGRFAGASGDEPWAVRVDWGDGSADVRFTAAAAGPLGTRQHAYADNGVYTVRLGVTGAGGHTGQGTFNITVANVSPTVGPIAAPAEPVRATTAVSASASFSDPGILDSHTAVWEWGDGSRSPGAVTEAGGSGSVAGTHSYAHAGVYTLKLTVTDKDGGQGTSVYQYVVVYDPDGGFVTGGGHITSPRGAYSADPAVSGRAVFGFVSKYLKDAGVPRGQTEFQLKVGNLNFHSRSYEWLVVAGGRAQYQGTGTINQQGDYGFMVTVIDGDMAGGGGPDKFRIKIWNKASGNVIYDNLVGSPDSDGTPLGGGSIVIHER